MKALIGIKKGMTRVIKDDKIVPVTVLDISGCILSNKEKMGFELGLGEKKKSSKAELMNSGRHSNRALKMQDSFSR